MVEPTAGDSHNAPKVNISKSSKTSSQGGTKQVMQYAGSNKNKEVLIERVVEKGSSSSIKMQQKSSIESKIKEPMMQVQTKKDAFHIFFKKST